MPGVGARYSALLLLALASLSSSACLHDRYALDNKTVSAPALGPTTVATRFARLTHVQWANSVRDLFGLDFGADVARNFRSDPNEKGFLFDTYAASFSVDEALWHEYQSAAAEVAERVTRDPSRLAKILPPASADSEARARTFITRFGALVHRRPLTPDQIDEYLGIFDQGGSAYPGMGEFEAGVRLLIEAFLQSPYFVYRIEGNGGSREGAVRLDAYDLASRLSYTLWNTMPDRRLFDEAATGRLLLRAVIGAEARRMLDDPRARAVVSRFHAQLFERDRLNTVTPSRQHFPTLSEHFTEDAARESDLFFRYQVFDRNNGFKDLLTATDTFVNADLAKVYGLQGSFGDEFQHAELDPKQRRGFLTQVAFLASHATSVDPDPIHRGVFVARRVLCVNVSAPPGMVPPLPASAGRTNRATVEAHTETEGSVCASCHKQKINPLGFPFENYDAIGRYRTEDAGQPVDTATYPYIDSKAAAVADGVQLALAIASSEQAHRCYAQHWLEYTYGRPYTTRDQPLVQRLGSESAAGRLSVKDLIVELLEDDAFSTIYEEDLK